MSSVMQQVLQAQSIFMDQLMAKRNVVGVAVGYKHSKGERTDDLAVVTLVEQKKPLAALSADEIIPGELDGVRTDVFEVGQIRALDSPMDRFRPVIPSGVSIGHYKVTAGTLGTIVTDRTSGEKLILSNNHVLANSNDALVGDAILQPAAMDGGQNPGDMVARLLRFIPLQYLEDAADPITPTPDPTPTPEPDQPSGCDAVDVVVKMVNYFATLLGSTKRVEATTSRAVAPTAKSQTADAVNLVDCAVAKPINPDIFTGEIRGIGQVSGTKAPALGMRVRKSGRTSGYTEGAITLMNATVNVAYNTVRGNRTARFTGQVITEPMSQGGDSGSLMVDQIENKAVGLLFAGSSAATIFIPIDRVLDALNVNI
jgi:hypothetical protein